jgi:AIPR protein/Abortive infection phage resistance protein N-terminal domain
MSTELEQYAETLHQDILAQCTDETTPRMREEVFTETILDLLSDHNETEGGEICYHERKSSGRLPAAKLNAWALSGDGATLDLFITLYHGTGKVFEVGKPDTRRQFQLLRGFLRQAMDGLYKQHEESSDGFHAMREIYEDRDTLATVRLFFITDGLVRSLDLEEEPFPGLDIRYVVWDLEKLSRLRVGEREIIALDFGQDYGGSIPCIEATADREYHTYLAFFPAPLLARIYGEFGQRLLERNVRAFLQVKGRINKGLQATLRDEPNRFLAYNNGLCCTAAEVRLEPEGGMQKLAWVKDFQIVNGGQTTASIFHAQKKEKLDLSHVSVQVKLTVINDPDQVAEIVPMISRFANSQNKVNGADFSANGKFHRDLEELSRTIWAPATSGLERGTHWYYERARGSYFDDKARQGTPAKQTEWGRQNPPKQKFTKTDLAKYEHAWLGLPHLVCRGAEKNFEAFASRLEDDGEPLVDPHFFEQVVARVILWRTAEKLFDTLDLVGYRANSVAYAVAWLAERSNRGLDLATAWRQQRFPEAVESALRVVCREAYQYLTTRPGNTGEISKKPETWAEFRATKIDVKGDWSSGSTNGKPIVYPQKKSSAEAIVAKEAIAPVSSDDWFALAKWAKERGFLEGWERGLAYSLGKLAGRGAEASDKQAIQGARIMKRASELGFTNTGSPVVGEGEVTRGSN